MTEEQNEKAGFNLNFFKKKSSDNNPKPLNRAYVTRDGVRVTEVENDFGKTVMELFPDGVLISRLYDKKNVVRQDYIRKRNLELVHRYDEGNVKIVEIMKLYDEHNNLARTVEKMFQYHDNGKKMSEVSTEIPSGIKTFIQYNESEVIIEKIVQRGSVKTFYNAEDKPFRREIDRGTGGIVFEDIIEEDANQ
ncbi:MAG: hypothetical protein R3Y28_02075 [Candidatus Gastranaerophilales bacterium]